jgi:hypothetical protein
VLQKASMGAKMVLKESAAGRTLQHVAREFIRRASAGDYAGYFLNLHQSTGVS